LLKPAFAVYNSGTTDQQLATLPLSNDTIRRPIDEIVIDLQSQLNDTILRNTKFSLTVDESTVQAEALLLGYVRFQPVREFVEKCFFASL